MDIKKILLLPILSVPLIVTAAEKNEPLGITPYTVGGEIVDTVDLSKYKSYVQLQLGSENSFSQHCGGSILSDTLILTAAHCVQSQVDGAPEGVTFDVSELHVVVKNTTRDIYKSELKAVKRIIPHENFLFNDLKNGVYTNQKYNDIAILELVNPINQKDNVESINLPSNRTDYNVEANIFDLVGLGYALTDEEAQSNYDRVQEIIARQDQINNGEEVTIIVRDRIEKKSPDSLTHVSLKYLDDTSCSITVDGSTDDLVLCTQSPDKENGDFGSTGAGDSGGPLYFNNPSTGLQEQVGIVNTVLFDETAYFTELFHHKDWINQVINNNGLVFGSAMTYDASIEDNEIHSVGDGSEITPDPIVVPTEPIYPEPTYPEEGNSGGSFNFFAIFGLISVALARRKQK